MSLRPIQGVEEMERTLAERYLLARLIREVRVLREIAKSAPATGTIACNVCFRPYPHSEETHARDQHYLEMLPEDGFGADGFGR